MQTVHPNSLSMSVGLDAFEGDLKEEWEICS